jgi:hypothetical protein
MANRKALKMPSPFPTPPGADGQQCAIIFGHNVEARKVLMKFSVTASQLVFSPDEAEDVASKLQHYAKAARGHKPS